MVFLVAAVSNKTHVLVPRVYILLLLLSLILFHLSFVFTTLLLALNHALTMDNRVDLWGDKSALICIHES